jgi:hypothetical protein
MTFEAAEMRWGVLDSSTAEHLTSELCIRELYKCLDESAGPAFFSILGNKYGYRPFPPSIEASIYEKLSAELERLAGLSEAEIVSLFGIELLRDEENPKKSHLPHGLLDLRWKLDYWFKLELNSVPPKYILLPSLGPGDWDRIHIQPSKTLVSSIIRTRLPYGRKLERKEDVHSIMEHLKPYLLPDRAKDWKSDEWIIMRLLRAASYALPYDLHRKFVQSVTEDEVMNGITRPEKFIGVQRNFEGLQDRADELLRSANPMDAKPCGEYVDLKWKGNTLEKVDMDAVAELADLKKRIVPKPIQTYNVPWLDGFNPKDPSKPQHAKYLREFCDLMTEQLCHHILKMDAERIRIRDWDALGYEVLSNWKVIEDMKSLTEGNALLPRTEVLDKMFAAMKQLLDGGVHIVTGSAGCGKTALMASIAEQAREKVKEWDENRDLVVITRFVGATSESSDAKSLMRTISEQILRVYFGNVTDATQKLAESGLSDDSGHYRELLEMYVQNGEFTASKLSFDDCMVLFPICLRFATSEKPMLIVSA